MTSLPPRIEPTGLPQLACSVSSPLPVNTGGRAEVRLVAGASTGEGSMTIVFLYPQWHFQIFFFVLSICNLFLPRQMNMHKSKPSSKWERERQAVIWLSKKISALSVFQRSVRCILNVCRFLLIILIWFPSLLTSLSSALALSLHVMLSAVSLATVHHSEHPVKYLQARCLLLLLCDVGKADSFSPLGHKPSSPVLLLVTDGGLLAVWDPSQIAPSCPGTLNSPLDWGGSFWMQQNPWATASLKITSRTWFYFSPSLTWWKQNKKRWGGRKEESWKWIA